MDSYLSRDEIIGQPIKGLFRGPWQSENYRWYEVYVRLASGRVFPITCGVFGDAGKDAGKVKSVAVPINAVDLDLVPGGGNRFAQYSPPHSLVKSYGDPIPAARDRILGQRIVDLIDSDNLPISSYGVVLENGLMLSIRDVSPIPEFHLFLDPIPYDAKSIWGQRPIADKGVEPQIQATNEAPPKRRWFRFSLRTLFVVVTIVALFAGYYTNQHLRRERARAWLESHGQPGNYGVVEQSRPVTVSSLIAVEADKAIFVRREPSEDKAAYQQRIVEVRALLPDRAVIDLP